VDITALTFGLSAWICTLHIELTFKKQADGDDDRRKVTTHKELCGKKFLCGMGLLVDQAKPGGCGTIDVGNRARRFFKDPSHSECISGLSKMLIRICVLLHY